MEQYMFVMPKENEPYRFVARLRRRWLFWHRVEYSYLPTKVDAIDYCELAELRERVMKENEGREVVILSPHSFDKSHEQYLFYAVRPKSDAVEWYTGRWFAERRGGKKQPETSRDIRDCQFFVREQYAMDELQLIQREGFTGIIERVYIRTENQFRQPCIVTLCINKRTQRVQYLRSDGGDKWRVQYTNRLADAMLIYPEDCEALYERLSTQHKAHSFTMIVRPESDIPASEIRKHEKELKQGIATTFNIRRYGKV